MDERKQLAALAANLAGGQNVVPFGKYKGQPVEVMRRDQSYMDWAYGQDGIRNAYPWIFSITINTGSEPSETPEHNRYQALFLDQEFANDVFDHVCRPGYREQKARGWDDNRVGPVRPADVEVEFEVCREWRDGYRTMKSGPADVQLGERYDSTPIRIEIKPSMGDEYPAVLRQMQSNQCNVLYLVRYTGSGATLAQVRQMFGRSGIHILMHEVFWEDC